MPTKKITTRCLFCRKDTIHSCITMVNICHKVYFACNCENCGKTDMTTYKVKEEIWNTDFNLKQCIAVTD